MGYSFLFIIILSLCHFLFPAATAQNITVINVGVIGQLDWFGKVAKAAFELAAEDVNKDNRLLNSTQRIVLHIRETDENPILAASQAVDLLRSGVVGLIGPQTSQEVAFVMQLCDVAHVPMVSPSATDPLLSSHRFPYFVRLRHSDAVQMKAIAALVNNYGWRNVVAIYGDNDYGIGALSWLSDYLGQAGSKIAFRCPIPINASNDFIRGKLYELMTMQSRVFVVHMSFSLGQIVFSEAEHIGMMNEEYAWIITEGFSAALDVMNASSLDSMKGVLGIRSYVPKSAALDNFRERWKYRFAVENPGLTAQINVYAYYAYDAVSLIAQALQKLGNYSFSFSESPLSGRTELTTIKVFEQGQRLMQLISETDFEGLSGRLKVERGEIAGATYEILNVVGENGYRHVGLWKDGKSGGSEEIGDLSGLEPVIWPGGSKTPPVGWATPAKREKVLRIGVPIKHGFEEFVMTSHSGNEFTITGGFVIDVFENVVKLLPYALPYKFYPYGNGSVTPSYDELVSKVYTTELDAVVGDVTILANRSNYVDFTQPFSESGLVMVVPIKNADSSNAWAFLRPFTPRMWIVIVGFFIFTGIVIWVLEHKRNRTFRGTPGKQVVTLIWFSLSTLFFAQRERIVSSLARGVVIVWLFVVLILMSSYTASLTSILTVQQVEPSISDVQSLIASRAPVGYQGGSFVAHFLQEKLGFDETQLHSFQSPQDYAVALSKGPKRGGVAAIFDEHPYMRVFLASECGFTMVGPTYRTGGYGFVFAKGSPYVMDVSRAVLELSESSEMRRLEKKWFNMTMCTKAGAQVNSNSVTMESFWVLYLFTGTASIIALLAFTGRLLYRYRRNGPGLHNRNFSSHVKSFVSFVDQKERPSARRTSNTSKRSTDTSVTFNNNYSSYGTPGLEVSAKRGSMMLTSRGDLSESISPASSSRSSSPSWVAVNLFARDDDVIREEVHHPNR